MIIKIEKHDIFVVIDKRCVENTALSWKARGILAYLLSRPPDWTVRMSQLVSMSEREGPDAVRSAFKELQMHGYARLEAVRVAGKMAGQEWIIQEEPDRDAGFPSLGKPRASGKSRPTNKEHVLTKKCTVPPARGEAEAYAIEKGLPLPELDAWFDHYESNGWKVGRNPMKDWKAAINNWLRNRTKYDYRPTYGTNKKTPTESSRNDNLNAGKYHQYEGIGRVR